MGKISMYVSFDSFSTFFTFSQIVIILLLTLVLQGNPFSQILLRIANSPELFHFGFFTFVHKWQSFDKFPLKCCKFDYIYQQTFWRLARIFHICHFLLSYLKSFRSWWSFKGQIISKANCQAQGFSKKTNKNMSYTTYTMY